MICWSYGGGWQSVAIGVLIRMGLLPVPDFAGICDTGRERRTTWDYMNDVMLPYLDPIGLTISRIPHSLASADLYAKSSDLPLVPAYTRSVGLVSTLWGEQERAREGRLPTYCSGWWKRDVFERWLRSRGVKRCRCWIGFSADEADRVKADHRDWCRYEYPLIGLRMTRNDCRNFIEAAGLPMPKKSRCWCCPHQTAEEWAEVRDDAEEWALAVALDQQIRDADPEGTGLYLSSQRVPLPLMAFGEGGLPARPCEGGHCWT